MNPNGSFPTIRARRLRQNSWIRDLVAENNILPSDLIWPVFVIDGKNEEQPVGSLPGVSRMSPDVLVNKLKMAEKLGIKAAALFPVIADKLKSTDAKEAYNKNNLICKTVKAIKDSGVNIGIICDVALDPYTSHGHDGILVDGYIENDKTNEVLCKQAISLAKAGCDVVAPSDMMDGRIGAIRNTLENDNYKNTLILSYAAKYASYFYGPFRDAVGSAGNLGKADKKTYQMDIRNSKEAIKEVALDIQEGADMIMIKPGIAYLDILKTINDQFRVPIFAYQVSGEYAMIKAAGQNGWIDENAVLLESLTAFKRAGANGVFTYAAIEIAKLLEN